MGFIAEPIQRALIMSWGSLRIRGQNRETKRLDVSRIARKVNEELALPILVLCLYAAILG